MFGIFFEIRISLEENFYKFQKFRMFRTCSGREIEFFWIFCFEIRIFLDRILEIFQKFGFSERVLYVKSILSAFCLEIRILLE